MELWKNSCPRIHGISHVSSGQLEWDGGADSWVMRKNLNDFSNSFERRNKQELISHQRNRLTFEILRKIFNHHSTNSSFINKQRVWAKLGPLTPWWNRRKRFPLETRPHCSRLRWEMVSTTLLNAHIIFYWIPTEIRHAHGA